MIWKIIYTKQAQKDARKLAASNLKEKAQQLLDIIGQDSYMNPPSYEKLVGNLSGAYSRRINVQHRLVYQIYAEEKMIKIIRMWTHYE